MKVLRSLEWEPVAWIDNMPTMDTPVYLFKHRRWRDVIALKVAKYVDVTADVVYFYDAINHEVSVRGKNSSPIKSTVKSMKFNY